MNEERKHTKAMFCALLLALAYPSRRKGLAVSSAIRVIRMCCLMRHGRLFLLRDVAGFNLSPKPYNRIRRYGRSPLFMRTLY
jgi:hypothetical protein